MKLDVHKAYDMIEWHFLCKILEAFGFSCQWINLIFKCISKTKIYVLINRSPKGLFEISRGIRKGDLLSMFLYIITKKGFGRSIMEAFNNKEIKGVIVTINIPNIAH